MEFTPNFNANPGGFLVDPNAPEQGGKFAVGIGSGDCAQQRLLHPAERRRVAPLRLRDRHAARRPRTDHPLRRRPAGRLHEDRHRAPAPATSPTRSSTSCRAPPARLFGAGDLDEVALYNRRARRRRRSPSTSAATAQPPTASFTADAEPGADRPDRSASTARPRATPTARSPSTSGTSTATAPTRPTPAPRATATHDLRHRGHRTNVRLRVTDNAGNSDQATTHAHGRAVRAPAPTRSRVLATAGLTDYWRMGETTGTTLADGRARAGATLSAAPTLGRRPARWPATPTPRSASTAPTTPPSADRQPVRRRAR